MSTFSPQKNCKVRGEEEGIEEGIERESGVASGSFAQFFKKLFMDFGRLAALTENRNRC